MKPKNGFTIKFGNSEDFENHLVAHGPFVED